MKNSFYRLIHFGLWIADCRLKSQIRNPQFAMRNPKSSRLRLLPLEDRTLPSGTPHMILDINTWNLPSNPQNIVAVGSTAYFAANDGIHGNELWKSDGTATGTILAKDIFPGLDYKGKPISSDPSDLTNVDGELFFSAGGELWKSDGTTAGTVLVKDFDSTIRPSNLTNVNGTVFFSADDYVHGVELWKSDGTAGGTVLLKDINPGSGYSYPGSLTNLHGTLYFAAYDGNYYGLWKSDGTAAGTTLVKNIDYVGSNYHQGSQVPIGNLTNVNGTLFFSPYEATHGHELWKSDGTTAGTVLLKDINPGKDGSYPRYLTNVNGTLYFSANVGSHSDELWKSDGTAAGTVLVKDFYFGNGFFPSTKNLITFKGTLYFTVNDGSHGMELWTSDGTVAGTVLVKDISPGYTGSYPSSLTNVNGTLYFWAAGGLWKSDGSAAGTTLVSSPPSPSISLTNVNGTLFFSADDGVQHGRELWKSDGTPAGTGMVKDINLATYDSNPSSLTNIDGTLWFGADHGPAVGLWKSDGTATGTTLVKDILPAFSGQFSGHYLYYSSRPPGGFTKVNGTLFFAASDGVHGQELWKSDGTAAGTTLVKDIFPGTYFYYGNFFPNSSRPSNLTNLNGTLYFLADDGVHGREVWKCDGTPAGTVMVKDINPSSNSESISELTIFNGTLYFPANDGVHGDELWKSDGTAAGTGMVADIRPGSGSSYPGNLTTFKGALYFSAYDGTTQSRALWKSDGTATGTVLVKDIDPGVASSGPYQFKNVNGTLFFSAYDDKSHMLWKSDGTTDGTVLVKDINPGSFSHFAYFTNVNGTLFFELDDSIGAGVWKSDGTADGTVLVKDFGANTLNPKHLTNVNGTLYFSADDGVHGDELWQSDGTSAGTVMVADIYPGIAGSYPATPTNFALVPSGGFAVLNGSLYFSADDGFHGRELWRLPPPKLIAKVETTSILPVPPLPQPPPAPGSTESEAISHTFPSNFNLDGLATLHRALPAQTPDEQLVGSTVDPGSAEQRVQPVNPFAGSNGIRNDLRLLDDVFARPQQRWRQHAVGGSLDGDVFFDNPTLDIANSNAGTERFYAVWLPRPA
jgi:ELWxxDGT repeat protein